MYRYAVLNGRKILKNINRLLNALSIFLNYNTAIERRGFFRLLKALLIFLILEPLYGCSSIFKSGLTDRERNLIKDVLIKDVEKFNRDYGSKGVTIKNIKIGWEEGFVCNGLILKNSLIKNVELQMVDLSNTCIENSRIENVSIIEKSDLSGSTFKNVKFKNFRSVNDMRSRLRDSVFIDCEFVDCEFSFIAMGNEYRNCKFKRVKEIKEVNYYGDVVITDNIYTDCEIRSVCYGSGRFENLIFKNSVVKAGFKDSKNLQFINCLTKFGIDGKAEDILVRNSKPDNQTGVVFSGDGKNIVIENCLCICEFIFEDGAFSNVSIINCGRATTKFKNVKLNNLLIKNSIVYDLLFDRSDVGGDNRIENSEVRGNFYGKSKVRNLTITDCTFTLYIDIVLSELIRLRLSNNIYKIDDGEHAIIGEKYTDSDKFPLKSTPFPKDNWYLK